MTQDNTPLWTRYKRLTQAPVSGFVQIISNQETPDDDYSLSIPGDGLSKIYQYLHSVTVGNGIQAYCPFVGTIERKNMYYAKVYEREFTPDTVAIAARELEIIFAELSPGKTGEVSGADLTSIVAGFTDAGAVSEAAWSMLDEAHGVFRLPFIERGLMIACMHTFHPVGGRPGSAMSDKPMFVSEIPLLVVRRMNKEDAIFMRNEYEKSIFASFFGDVKPKCPYHRK